MRAKLPLVVAVAAGWYTTQSVAFSTRRTMASLRTPARNVRASPVSMSSSPRLEITTPAVERAVASVVQKPAFPEFIGLMAASGAALGPFLDNYHSKFQVLRYAHPLLDTPWLTTDWWVPPLFGLAGVIIGSLYVLGDALELQIREGSAMPEPSAPKVLFTIALFTGQYWLSGLLSGGAGYHLGCGPEVQVPLLLLALFGYVGLDGTVSGLAASTATALSGPVIELGITAFGLYSYLDADLFVADGAISSWIPQVYFLGGPAVGNLARALWAWRVRSSATGDSCATTMPIKRLVVVGGSGRVGGSTVKHLLSEAASDGTNVQVTVVGRSEENFAASKARIQAKLDAEGCGPLTDGLRFAAGDVDDLDGLTKIFCQLDADLVVHTAGPFQQKTRPVVLEAAQAARAMYVDVCDEITLCKAAKDLSRGVSSAVVSGGIWPGVSALMAAEAVELLRQGRDTDGPAPEEDLTLSFFTAGTGNAGATIVSATFLLLAQTALTYAAGREVEMEPWTRPLEVDFGAGIGRRTVRLLDNPDVYTTQQALGTPSVASRFATAPGVWNQLFGAAKALPTSLLANREAMQSLSIFSLPIIRAVDKLVGATNSMRVEASNGDSNVTFLVTHDDLEECVGLATAAFALEMLEPGACPPGVFFPAELPQPLRAAILSRVKKTSLVWELSQSSQN